MVDELVMQVRWPIADLEAMARKKYRLEQALTDFRLEGDAVVLYFTQGTTAKPEANVVPKGKSSGGLAPKRRRSGKRNRMRTRGWKVVGHIQNSKGQRCTIYAPFVNALKSSGLSDKDKRSRVRDILKSNGNRPSDASIEYYLNNTEEFLQQGGLE